MLKIQTFLAAWLIVSWHAASAASPRSQFPNAAAFPVQVLPAPSQLPELLFNAKKIRGGDSCRNLCNLRTATSASYQDTEGRAHLMAVIVAEVPDYETSHADAALISMVDFVHVADGWSIDAGAPFITEAGTWGKAPEIQIIDAGKWQKGVVLMPGGEDQGVTQESWQLWLPDHGFHKAADIDTLYDSSGHCDDEPRCRTDDFKTKIQVLVSPTGDGSLFIIATSDKSGQKVLHIE